MLVAVMKKLSETVPMAAFDHKGRCVFANTPLASMLGFKLSVLRTKEISQLLPQPYGRLHMKWITVRMPGKGQAGRCLVGPYCYMAEVQQWYNAGVCCSRAVTTH